MELQPNAVFASKILAHGVTDLLDEVLNKWPHLNYPDGPSK